jgi:hypothetical protein
MSNQRKQGKGKGVDAIPTILYSDNEQLRGAAITRMTTLHDELHAGWHAADEAFRAKEQEFLEAVAAWRRAGNSVTGRGEAAATVGRLQAELAELDKVRQSALYPHRFVQTKELFRTVIDADTRDQRKIPHPVYLENAMRTGAVERTVALL